MNKYVKATNNESGTLTALLADDETTTAYVTPVPNKAPGFITLRIGTANEEEIYYASKDDGAGTISTLTRDTSSLNGGNGREHPNGSAWETAQSATYINQMVDGFGVEHNNTDGTHKAATVTTLKATGAVVKTGTSDTTIVTPKALADAGIKTVKVVGVQVVDAGTDTATGDGKAYFRVPLELNGMNLIGVAASVYTAGTTNTTDIQIRNKTDSVDMLSTKLTIDSGETDSSTAAAAAVIDASKDDVATGDILAIDVDAVSTTAAKGLYVELRFQLP